MRESVRTRGKVPGRRVTQAAMAAFTDTHAGRQTRGDELSGEHGASDEVAYLAGNSTRIRHDRVAAGKGQS